MLPVAGHDTGRVRTVDSTEPCCREHPKLHVVAVVGGDEWYYSAIGELQAIARVDGVVIIEVGVGAVPLHPAYAEQWRLLAQPFDDKCARASEHVIDGHLLPIDELPSADW